MNEESWIQLVGFILALITAIAVALIEKRETRKKSSQEVRPTRGGWLFRAVATFGAVLAAISAVVVFSSLTRTPAAFHMEFGGPERDEPITKKIDLFKFSKTNLITGGGDSKEDSIFVVPRDGVYVFSLSFTRDPVPGVTDSADDVHFTIVYKRGSQGPNQIGGAWAPQSSKRETVSTTVVHEALEGDEIFTQVYAQDETPWILKAATFVGYSISDFRFASP